MSKNTFFDFHQKDITLEESRNNLLEYDFCLLLMYELASQKNLCNKENILLNWSYYTLKFSFFSIWVSKCRFHSILHLTIWQQGYNNERKFFFFNKLTISYKKDNLVPRFLNTRMDILKNSPIILSTWDFEIWLPPYEVRVAPTHWGDVNPISASTNNTTMPHTHMHVETNQFMGKKDLFPHWNLVVFITYIECNKQHQEKRKKVL
jgi:hypothetical protein